MLKNRVKETTTSTGTGAVTPGGAVAKFRTFAASGLTTGNVFPMLIEVPSGPWEISLGTFQSNGSVTRTLEDSSTGALLNLTGEAGTTMGIALSVAGFNYGNLFGNPPGFSTTTYSASGALSLTDTLSILDAPSGSLAMTLANGTYDRQPFWAKLKGAASATITGNIDWTSNNVVSMTASGSGTLKDGFEAFWSVGQTTWLAR